MKTMKRCLSVLALVLLFALLGGMLVSCDTDSRTVLPFAGSKGDGGGATPYVTEVTIDNGSIIVTYSDGSRVNIGSSVTNVNKNVIDNVTIEGGAGGTTEFAASRALQSTVQVVCKFKKTVDGWYYSQEKSYATAGSGVIYRFDEATGDAYIITNQHVVYDSDSKTSAHVSDDISVYLPGSTSPIPVAYVGGSADYDIAVLRVKETGRAALKASDALAATPANSSALYVGSTALVVGNPEGSGISATAGIISVDSEYIQMTAIDNQRGIREFRVIRVDAAVNSGNSGGGLYNEKGELIGIVNAKSVSESGESGGTIENIGYAIPSNVAIAVAENIVDNGGTLHRALLNIKVQSENAHIVYDEETFRTSIVETVRVSEVSAGVGKNMGILVGDVLQSVKVGGRDAVQVTRSFHMIDEMLNARVGDTVTVTVLRNGQTETLTGTVGADWFR